ncbi:nickel ABC transporter permease subunit NikB [Anaerobacillus alkalidiazotrophicus]|uniref:Nickel import system permease protein NikB n=1 Tax=Anaerobacillus alkalidiazotrophicus TaxID=472963 RepID=A0A1S2M5C4_9BACI|nr:nickel/cobalt ABC transporter permease [Anaerobacillus alkalidiazotrophicus]OIJ18184.1 nickel ABC transporter permease subunit NikB [Anaerobacillus alkalidiazotrophicus]OIJ19663.1 nickel ABC transporter permease subunit NikB [Anaerobacillus alkalidiazotrophicus]
MKNYIIKRIVSIIPIIFAITFLAFILINIVPSDPAEVAIRVNDAVATPEAIEITRAELGLDDPFFVRYYNWLRKSVQLDFGNSYISKKPVLDELLRVLPATIQLALASLVIIIIISIPIGVLSAVYKDSLFDKGVRSIVFIGTAMPNYWIGLLLIWLFSVKLNLLPTSGKGDIKHLILPSITLSLTYISIYIRLIRNNMLENMRENYVLYANVRGLRQRSIVLKHILKNSIHSCITAFGMSIAQLIAGTFVIESIFAWPGIGMLCISAIFNRDYPVIQAYILMMAFIFIICNLVVDIINYYIDPRMRKGIDAK